MDYKLLEKLCFTFGVAGDETEISELIVNEISPYCDFISKDTFGNLIVTKKSDENAPTVMLDAHMDSVGFVVKEICDNGFLKFEEIGGIDNRVLPGTEVFVNGKKKTLGVITSKPPHLIDDSDKDRIPEIKNMFIDTGISDNLSDMVSKGDLISFKPHFTKLLNSVSATYLDNRIGCYVLIKVFEALKDLTLPFNLVAVFSTQEEMGLLGAKHLKFSPDFSVVVDVTHAKTPDENTDESFKSGQGTAIGIGPNINFFYSSMLIDFCKKEQIKYQIEVLEASSGTNAWKYQVKNKGIPNLVLSVPLKFMHTPVETASVSDINNIVLMIEKFLKLLDEHTIKNNCELVKLK